MPKRSNVQLTPDPASIAELLDAIPGAHERAREGLRQVKSGEGVPLGPDLPEAEDHAQAWELVGGGRA